MTKNKFNKKKALLISFLVALPTAMLFGFLITNAKAAGTNEYVPEESIYNNWHWTVNEGDLYNYTLDMTVTSLETGELISRFKMIYIVQITDISNITNFNLMGIQNEVSQISGTSMFYNVTTDNLQLYGDPYTMGTFVYNDTVEPHLRYLYGQGWIMPMLLPVNDSVFDGEQALADALYDTYYYAYLREETNLLDDYGVSGREIWFENSSNNDLYLDMWFYDTGVLEYGEAKYLNNFGPEHGGWVTFEYVIENVGADINVTDEIQWGLDVGEVYYAGRSSAGFDEEEPYFDEAKIVVKKFNLTNEEIPTIFEDVYTTFQNVIVDIYIWNWITEEFELNMSNVPLGCANNDYIYPPWWIEGGGVGVIPNNTVSDDFTFMGEVYQSVGLEYGLNGWEFKVWDDKDDFLVYQLFDLDTGGTGGIELQYYRVEGNLVDILFRKNMTELYSAAIVEPLYCDIVQPTQVTVNFLVSGLDLVNLYSSVLPVNPIEPLGHAFSDDVPGVTVYIDSYTNASASVYYLNYTISYSEARLNELGIPESSLQVYFFNWLTDDWEKLTSANYTINTGLDTITVNTTKFELLAIGVPEAWNWSSEIGVGNNLIYESLGTLIGNVSDFGIVTFPYIDFSIMNMTAIGEVTKGSDTYNQINSTLLYYDPEISALKTREDTGTFTLSEYRYDDDRTPPFIFNLTEHMLGFPAVIPLRWKQLALLEIGDALNESFYSSQMVRDMGFPNWNEIKVNYVTDTLIFNDTTSKYYMMLTFYKNGTLKEAELKLKFIIDEQIVDFNLTTTRMFDYNNTDEVDWGVDVGETYYFGSNFPNGGPTVEVKIKIVAINETAVLLRDLFFDGGDGDEFFFNTWLTFSNVWAEIEMWNITSINREQFGKWIPIEGNSTTIVGAANNYFPFAPGNYLDYYGLEGSLAPILMPLGIDGYELADKFSDFLSIFALSSEGDFVPQIASVKEDYLKLSFKSLGEKAPTDYEAYFEWYLNNETGVTRLWYVYERVEDEAFISCIFTKNHSSDWSSGIPITYAFNNYLVPEISGNLTVDAPIGTEAYHVLEALLHKNPVNSSISSSWGTPMFYLDFFFINGSVDPTNFTITLKLPSKYYIGYVTTIAQYLYDPNIMDSGMWQAESINEIPFLIVTRDYANNILIINIYNVTGSVSIVQAWFYSPPAGFVPPSGGGGGGGEEAPVAIPGYDLWVILGIIAMLSLVIILKRGKFLRLA